MTYQVLARKWRPQNFEELSGQQEVLAALIHSLDEQRLHHAYLFTGTRGVGKTTVARIVAKALNCEKGVSAKPCNECQHCIAIKEGRFIDLIEIDAASRTKVEDTREILDNVQYAPSQGRFKVYLIDEVHMLSGHSFNALLKTLEEPPPHVKFLLATTDPQKLPITVLSRCLQFHLKNIPHEVIAERLRFILKQEIIEHDEASVTAIAKAAHGSLRDALSLLDQAINQGEGRLHIEATHQMLGLSHSEQLYTVIRLLIHKDSAALFQTLETISQNLVDYQELCDVMLELWYELSIKQQVPNLTHFEHPLEIINEFSSLLSPSEVQLFYQMTLHGKRDLLLAPTPALGFKMMMLRLLSFYPLQDSVRPPAQATLPKKTSPIAPHREAEHKQDSRIDEAPPPKKLEITDWTELVNVLPLSGMVKQLARHLSFTGQEGNCFLFSLSQAHKASLNERLQKDLTQTLKHYFAQEVNLRIALQETVESSPAAQQALEVTTQNTLLQEKLQADPHLDFIKNNFNATISDIKPNKTLTT